MAREVLAIRLKLLGPEHPWLAYSLDDIAWAAGARGNLEEAERERESLAMRQKLLGSEHPDVAKSLYLVGDRMRQKRESERSLFFLERGPFDTTQGGWTRTIRICLKRCAVWFALEGEGKMAEAEQMQS